MTSSVLPPDELRADPNALASHFYLVENSGAHLIPVRVRNSKTGVVAFVLHRKGSGNTRSARGTREIHDEREAYELVRWGHYAIRTVCERTGREALRIVGDRVERADWVGPTPPRSADTSGVAS